MAKLLVDVAVSAVHRCFREALYIDPQQPSTVKPPLTTCSPTGAFHLELVARCYGEPVGQGTATDTLGPEGMWTPRRDRLMGANPSTPAQPSPSEAPVDSILPQGDRRTWPPHATIPFGTRLYGSAAGGMRQGGRDLW